MLSRKINQFLLVIFFVTALACTANATMLEYSYSLPFNSSDVSILFTIDTDQGYKDSGYSMHNGSVGNDAYDSLFTISLGIDGTTYYDDAFDWTSSYPSVTLNTSDWSIDTIDYWVTTGTSGTMFVIESTSGSSTLTAVDDYSGLDTDGDGIIEEDEIGALSDTEIAAVIDNENNPSVTIDLSSWETSEIPEPATFTLFGLGLFGWAWFNRRKSLK